MIRNFCPVWRVRRRGAVRALRATLLPGASGGGGGTCSTGYFKISALTLAAPQTAAAMGNIAEASGHLA